MESKSFVLLDVPEIIDKEDYLVDYIECTLEQPLEYLQCLPLVPNRAFFTLQQATDVRRAARAISENPLEGHRLQIEPSIFRDVAVVEGEGVTEKVTPFFVKLYFQSEYGNCEEIVSRCLAIAGCEMIAVGFEHSEVLAEVLKNPTHFPLPSVGYEMKVRQFCENFHGLIPHINKLFYQTHDGINDEASFVQDPPPVPARQTTARKSKHKKRKRKKCTEKKIPDFDVREKVQVEKNLTRSDNVDRSSHCETKKVQLQKNSTRHDTDDCSSQSETKKAQLLKNLTVGDNDDCSRRSETEKGQAQKNMTVGDNGDCSSRCETKKVQAQKNLTRRDTDDCSSQSETKKAHLLKNLTVGDNGDCSSRSETKKVQAQKNLTVGDNDDCSSRCETKKVQEQKNLTVGDNDDCSSRCETKKVLVQKKLTRHDTDDCSSQSETKQVLVQKNLTRSDNKDDYSRQSEKTEKVHMQKNLTRYDNNDRSKLSENTKSSLSHPSPTPSLALQPLNQEEREQADCFKSLDSAPAHSRLSRSIVEEEIDDELPADEQDEEEKEETDQYSNSPLRWPWAEDQEETRKTVVSKGEHTLRIQTSKVGKFSYQNVPDHPMGNTNSEGESVQGRKNICCSESEEVIEDEMSSDEQDEERKGAADHFSNPNLRWAQGKDHEKEREKVKSRSGRVPTKETSRVKKFDRESLSELSAGYISSDFAPLDTHVYPSKSFRIHQTSHSTMPSGEASEKKRPEQSHDFFQRHDPKNKSDTSGTLELAQNEAAARKSSSSLRKSYWHLLKDSIKRMDFSFIHYDSEEELLTYESSPFNADDEECIEDSVADVIDCREKLSESMLELLETTHVQKYFKSYMLTEWGEEKDVYVEVDDGFLVCRGFDEDKIDKMKRKVMTDLFTLVEVDNQSLSMEAVENLKESLERKFKVHISWNKERAMKIQIMGVKDDVFVVVDRIQTMMDESMTGTKHFEFSIDESAYILEHCQDEIDKILKNVESFQDSAHDKLSISYSGKLKEVEKVSSALDNVRTELKLEEIDVANEFSTDEANLIVKELSLLSPDSSFQTSHDLFMAKHKCFILNDLQEEAHSRITPSASPPKVQKIVPSVKTCVSKKAVFILNPHMQLKIKDNGNIIHERSDVLVCVLDVNRQLTKTNVGKAFLSLKSDLQNTVDSLSFSSNGVGLVPFHSHKTHCKALVFVTLSSFERGVTEDYLSDIILEVLIKAAESKAASVSFPPIGLGRVMKYPEDLISGQFFSAVKAFVDNHSGQQGLRQIKLLACNRNLFWSLNKTGKTLFRKILKNNTDTKEEKDRAEPRESRGHSSDRGDDDFLVKNADIRIIHRQSENLTPRWKAELKNYVNHQQDIDSQLHSLPASLDQKIKTKLKTTPVLITTHTSKSGCCVLKLKGSRDHVMQMKAYIAEEIVKEGKGHPQRSLSTVPNRGSVAFMKHLASLEVSVPPYWKNKDSIESSLHTVNDKTRQGIEKLLLATWEAANVGAGNDARGIPNHSRIEFDSVQRIESPASYKIYASNRNRILQRKSRDRKLCRSINEISSKRRPVLTSGSLPDFMKQELCGEINEHYLFHGTKQDIVDPIIKQGLYPNLSSPSAMFGKGIYAAESSTKADQYTDDPKSRLPSGSTHSMFLVRMLLGDVFRCTKQHPSIHGKDSDKLVRPPCQKCQKDKCTCGVDNFDSVMGEDGWIFREFVVYEKCQCYPEYLIRYRRI